MIQTNRFEKSMPTNQKTFKPTLKSPISSASWLVELCPELIVQGARQHVEELDILSGEASKDTTTLTHVPHISSQASCELELSSPNSMEPLKQTPEFHGTSTYVNMELKNSDFQYRRTFLGSIFNFLCQSQIFRNYQKF